MLGAVGIALLVLPIIGMGALTAAYRRRTGVDLVGLPTVAHGGRARGRLILLVVSYVIAVGASAIWGGQRGIGWLPWVLAVLVFALTVLVGRAYDAALRAELRAPLS